MVEVRLHGALARDFGRVWNLDIATPGELVHAIECGKAGFRRAILALSERGMVFRVRSKDHDYIADDLCMTLGSVSRIDVIPVMRGAGAGFRFILGAVLFAVGAFTTVFGGAGTPIAGLGLSLMAGSVVEWLTPKMKRQEVSNSQMQSWGISGPTNTAEQGYPVPVIYGEVLTGSMPVSAGIIAAQVTPGGSVSAAVEIGGNTDVSAFTGGAGTQTMVIILSASPFNLDEPFAYTWSYTGFTNAVARRLTNASKGTMRLELDYTGVAETNQTDTGDVSVSVIGKDSSGTSSSSPVDVTVNKTVAVKVNIDRHSWYYGEGG